MLGQPKLAANPASAEGMDFLEVRDSSRRRWLFSRLFLQTHSFVGTGGRQSLRGIRELRWTIVRVSRRQPSPLVAQPWRRCGHLESVAWTMPSPLVDWLFKISKTTLMLDSSPNSKCFVQLLCSVLPTLRWPTPTSRAMMREAVWESVVRRRKRSGRNTERYYIQFIKKYICIICTFHFLRSPCLRYTVVQEIADSRSSNFGVRSQAVRNYKIAAAESKVRNGFIGRVFRAS